MEPGSGALGGTRTKKTLGFTLSWLGVKGKPTEAILAELRLRSTGVSAMEGESPFVGAMSDAGWYIIVADYAEHQLISAAVVERLSTDCDVLTCTVEEHVMISEATGWRNGRRLWSVTHRAEARALDIDAEGELPPEFESIRDDFTGRQEAAGGADADVDYIGEIPVVLAQRFTGYKHDEISKPFGGRGFEVLEQIDPPKTSWVQRLFGGS